MISPRCTPLLLLLAAQAPALPQERFSTDRESAVQLPLPEEDDAFVFAVFGDRTGGPAAGIQVLAQAVKETNLIDPDLVMTVGDLVDGYNEREEWLVQMTEYRSTMADLTCPWFPVPGNHDVYWRGPNRPTGEHDSDYEEHFGPLWYAFRHKDCWFVVLYSDEGNPETGEKNFGKPECQRMSPEQFAFLDGVLNRAQDARHVFLFLHHPRWHGGGYGDDWERVHARLAAAGNVTAVFAGHIHRMVYDGVRDGIEYMTLATVGGAQSEVVPRAGYLHHWNLVTVRDEGISAICIPVGAPIDPRSITRPLSDEARALAGHRAAIDAYPALDAEGGVDGVYRMRVTNPSTRPIDINLDFASADSRWLFLPDHSHLNLAPGQERELEISLLRNRGSLDSTFRLPQVTVQIDSLAEDHRLSLPARSHPLPLDTAALPAPAAPGEERALRFDGRRDHLRVAHGDLELPDGPFTLECWVQGRAFGSRVGLACKTESCEFGFFVNGGVPEFLVHLDGDYVSAKAPSALLQPGRWHHLAGVFDGEQVALYVDGGRVASTPGAGARTVRGVPFLIGADVTRDGRAASHFEGRIDELRLSVGARYDGERFEPAVRHTPDEATLLLLHLDELLGAWVYDASPRHRHPLWSGAPHAVTAER